VVVIRRAFDDGAGYPQIRLCLAVAVDEGRFTVAVDAVDNSAFAELTDDARLRGGRAVIADVGLDYRVEH